MPLRKVKGGWRYGSGKVYQGKGSEGPSSQTRSSDPGIEGSEEETMIQIRCDGCNKLAEEATDTAEWVGISPLAGQGTRHACSTDCAEKVADGIIKEMHLQRAQAMLQNGGKVTRIPKR